MKTIILSIAALLTINIASAQKVKEAEVPKAVVEAFQKKYPGAKANEWEKEGADYEVEFDLSKVESSALFGANGEFKAYEQEIKVAELPANVATYCTKTYPSHKISEASKITEASGKVTYEAELEKGKEKFDAIFDDKGNFLKKEDVSKEEDDDKKKK